MGTTEPLAPEPTDTAVVTTPSTTPPPAPRTYVVQKGDTLINLARRYYSDPARWKDIWQANRNTVPNPDRIMPGQELVLP
jgi:nucleoid-associated protein YgaU